MMKHMRPGFLATLCVLTLLPVAALASAEEPEPQTGTQSWRAQKCAVYQETRAEMLEEFPRGTLRSSFAKAEENYIANGCAGRAYACPETKTELKYANQMSLAMMSHGLSGTFLPYGCKSSIQ